MITAKILTGDWKELVWKSCGSPEGILYEDLDDGKLYSKTDYKKARPPKEVEINPDTFTKYISPRSILFSNGTIYLVTSKYDPLVGYINENTKRWVEGKVNIQGDVAYVTTTCRTLHDLGRDLRSSEKSLYHPTKIVALVIDGGDKDPLPNLSDGILVTWYEGNMCLSGFISDFINLINDERLILI